LESKGGGQGLESREGQHLESKGGQCVGARALLKKRGAWPWFAPYTEQVRPLPI